MTDTKRPARPVRWWPAAVILLVVAVALGVLLVTPRHSQQEFNIHIAQIVLFASCALLLWAFLGSRLRWELRLMRLGVLLLTGAATAALFRVRGVTGDLVPLLELRWGHRHLPIKVDAATTATTNLIPGAADYPQFLGPNRDGRLAGPKLATDWQAHPPVQLWRQPIGPAWSGFVVSGPFAVTQEQRGEDEQVVCRELATGRVLWSHADKTRYFNTIAGEGPRATPTIADGRVLAQGATGILNCLELATGRLLWSKDIFKENGGAVPTWGFSSSPLVIDGLVIVNAGGARDRSLVAYGAADGVFHWGGGTQGAGYSSPMAATFAGTRQILVFSDALVSHDATSGRVLWSFPWPTSHAHVAMPVVVSEETVLISSGYGTGSALLKIERDGAGKWSASTVWRFNRMKAKFANLVLKDGCIYGFDDGIMACLDARSGELKWKDGRYGHGQVILVGDLLLATAETGEVILLDPKPDKLRELSRFSALQGKTWNPPALAGELLLLRNDTDAACYRLSVEP